MGYISCTLYCLKTIDSFKFKISARNKKMSNVIYILKIDGKFCGFIQFFVNYNWIIGGLCTILSYGEQEYRLVQPYCTAIRDLFYETGQTWVPGDLAFAICLVLAK